MLICLMFTVSAVLSRPPPAPILGLQLFRTYLLRLDGLASAKPWEHFTDTLAILKNFAESLSLKDIEKWSFK